MFSRMEEKPNKHGVKIMKDKDLLRHIREVIAENDTRINYWRRQQLSGEISADKCFAEESSIRSACLSGIKILLKLNPPEPEPEAKPASAPATEQAPGTA